MSTTPRAWWALLAASVLGACSTMAPITGTELTYRHVTPEVAFEMLRDSPDALVLDLRPRDEPLGPMTGVRRLRRLPLAELAGSIAEFEPFRDQTFLVYCGGDPGCGEQAMRVLVENGCLYAVLIDGELPSWAIDGSEPAAEPPPPL